jgi:hypothetical protein
MPALVTTSVDGFMVSTDKSKLDGIEAGAQVTSFARVQTALGLASSAVSFNAQRLSSVLDPSAAQDAATKAYVDAIAQGLDVKASVRLVATTNVAALTGNVSIDGSTTAPGQRVLLAGQTTASANGIYLTAAGAWARTTDADTSAKVTSGMYVFVTEGTANANSGWALITPDPIVLGTTALTFSQVTGAGQLTAGAGMTKSGNQLDVVAHADGSIIVAADSVQLGVIATDAQHGARAGGTTHAAAIAGGASGFLTGSDKTKLDGIATAAAAVGSTTPVAADVTAAASGSATTAARSDHRHQVSAGSPVALTLAAATADGTSTSLARADHVHALPASSTTPTALTVGGAGSAGSSTSISKADHVHAMPATATTGADGFMASGDKSRLDALVASYKTAVRVASNAHIPNVDVPGNQPNVVDGISLAIGDRILVKDQVTVTYANNIYSVTTVGTGSNGTWAKAADADATGELVTGSTVYVAEGTQAGQWWQLTTLGAITIGTTAQAWARKTTPLATTAPASVGTAAAVGVGTTAARADHVHAHGAQTDGTLHAAATTSVAGFLSTADKTKLDGVATSAAALTSTAPSNVAAAAVVGVGTTAARFDHVHAHGAQTDGTLHAAATTSVAGFLSAADKLKLDGVAAGAPALASTAPANVAAAAVVGVGTTAARADHVHAHGAQTDGTLHAAATTSVAGFLSAADKTRLDALRARSYFDVRLATATTLPAYTATTISTNRPRLTATSNGALSIDGVAVVAGDLVLVLFESAANCGVYEVIAAGAAGTPYQLDLAYSGAYTAAVSGSQMIVRTGTAGTAYCNREFRPSSTSSGRFAEIPGPLQVWPRDVTPPTTIYPGWLYEIDALGSPISLTLVSPTGAADVLSGVSFGLNLTDSNATITITPTLGSHINGPADTNINPTATTFAAPRCATLQWVCGRGYTLYNPEHPYWRPVAAVADAATALGVGTTALVLLGGGAPTAGDVLTATSTSGASFAAPAADPSANGCRLSPTADDSPAADGTYSTIYLAPSKSDRIALYDGTNWRLYQVSSVSYAVTGRTTDLPFDIFAAQTAGVVSLEVVNWTSSTVRATAIARLNGVWTKSGDSTRRYLGTCRPRSATTYHLQTNGNDTTPAKCDLWNVDNQITAAFRYARSWTPETFTHPTASTWVGANGSSSRFEFIQGVAGSWTRAQAYAAVQTKTFVAVTGIGYDTVSTPSGTRTRVLSTNTNDIVTANGQYSLQSAIGVHYLAWIIYATNVAVVWWAAQSTHESGLEIAFQW